MNSEKLLINNSVKGRSAYKFPPLDVKPAKPVKDCFTRLDEAILPEVSELDLVRHFSKLSSMAFGVDFGFYPLGSCTMKYNPKVNERLASLDGFNNIHPLQDEDTVQGCLKIYYEMIKDLCEISGMDWGTLQPCAGAHGEYTGLKIIRSYFLDKKEEKRNIILIPESAHGTNPASAHMNGFDIRIVKSDERGLVDLDDLKKNLKADVAGIMLTNPNTLGLFEVDILKISKMVHEAGGLLYYDGANMNAIMGKARPRDMGFDVVHFNLHKTFSAPHGGGGPGSGPVLFVEKLKKFVPIPDVVFKDGKYKLDWNIEKSLGKVSSFYGNFLVIVRAYAYILSMGSDGLKSASEHAVLNANYMRVILKKKYKVAYDRICMHEFVLSLQNLKDSTGVSALDISKSLIDRGYHPPTMYFPMIVHEALMFEPTETESLQVMDECCDVILDLYEKAEKTPEELKKSPCKTVIGRVDEVLAARNPVLKG